MSALPPSQAVNAGCEVNSEGFSLCPQDCFLLYSWALTSPVHPRDPYRRSGARGLQKWFSSLTSTSIHQTPRALKVAAK